MANEHEIDSKKILVKDIFSTMWFRIPEYQRPYIWGKDEINDLLDDLTFALAEKSEQEYFLGSFVFQTKKANSEQQFDENDLLDGQQRMTTLLMLLACGTCRMPIKSTQAAKKPSSKKVMTSTIYPSARVSFLRLGKMSKTSWIDISKLTEAQRWKLNLKIWRQLPKTHLFQIWPMPFLKCVNI